jgi:hypothetical protein
MRMTCPRSLNQPPSLDNHLDLCLCLVTFYAFSHPLPVLTVYFLVGLLLQICFEQSHVVF